MRIVLFKRKFLLCGFTVAGVGLLIIAGLLLTFWMANNHALGIVKTMDGIQFGWWRAVNYSALLLLWPRLVSGDIYNSQQSQRHQLSRRPLIILIILYECLIVQNPLSVILAWVG